MVEKLKNLKSFDWVVLLWRAFLIALFTVLLNNANDELKSIKTEMRAINEKVLILLTNQSQNASSIQKNSAAIENIRGIQQKHEIKLSLFEQKIEFLRPSNRN